MNPIKKIRHSKQLSLDKFGKLIDSNGVTISKVEKGDCLDSTYLTIIRKMSLYIENVDELELVRDYRKWLENNHN